MLATTTANPYIGPRPFERKDQKLFFGRDFESDEIISLIFSHQLLLVYAQSGAGKTSIFNGQIIPQLENNGFDVLPIARIRLTSELAANHSDSKNDIKSSDIRNIYVFNTLQSLDPSAKSESLLNKSLSQFLKEHYPVKTDDRENPKPQILIFDQFEELFNLFVDDNWHENQKSFFRQITNALDSNPSLRCVFVIREDYVARLDPFKEILPEKLRARFRLERLSQTAALTAIKGPLKVSGVMSDEFDDEIKKVIDDLLKIRVESFGKGTRKTLEINGNFVEPIQLQVVCQKWWTERVSTNSVSGGAKISPEYTTNVDAALEDFYDVAIKAAANSPAAKRSNVNEKKIREWCEKKLITSSETRAIVYQGDKFTEGLPNDIVEILDKRYLIRPELRSGAAWYELTHDRLIRPVKESNLKRNEEEKKKKSKQKWLITIPSVTIGGILLAIFIPQLLFAGTEQLLPLGHTPTYAAINNDTNMIYVSNTGNGSVSVIDGTTNKVIENIPGLNNPSFLAVDPKANRIYVSDLSNDTISIIDGNNNNVIKEEPIKLKNFQLRHIPSGLYPNPQTNTTYVTMHGSNNIYAINGTTNQIINESIPVPQYPSRIFINPESNVIYALAESEFQPPIISAINGTTNQIINESIPVPQNPSEIIINLETNVIYVLGLNVTDPESESQPSIISAINGTTNQIINESIPVPQNPSEIIINLETNVIYVLGLNVTDPESESQPSIISAINGTTNQVINESIPVPQNPSRIFINPESNMIYVLGFNVTDPESESRPSIISAINGTTNQVVNESIPVPQYPSEIFINPETNMLYVLGDSITESESQPSIISAINGTTNQVVNESIPVPQNPSRIFINPESNMIYVLGFNVTDPESESRPSIISAINGTTNQVINESIPVPQNPSRIFINPESNMIYVLGFNVTDPESESRPSIISAINGTTNQVVNENIEVPYLSISQYASYLDVDPNTDTLYVLGYNKIGSRLSEASPISILNAINTKSNKLEDSILLSEGGFSHFSVDLDKNVIYSTNMDELNVIDGNSHKVLKQVPLNEKVQYVTHNPNTNMIYAAGSDFISVINGTTYTEEDVITLDISSGDAITDIIVNPNTNMIYAAGSDSISAIDGNTNSIAGEFSVGRARNILDLSVNPRTNTTYASDFDSNTIYALNPENKVISIIEGPKPPSSIVGKESTDIFINPNNTNMIYAAGSDSISVIDGIKNELLNHIRIETEDKGGFDDKETTDDRETPKDRETPEKISFNEKTNMMYVPTYNSSSSEDFISVINGSNKVAANIPLNDTALDIDIDEDKNFIYVLGGNSISIIDGARNLGVDNIELPADTTSDILYNPKAKTIYAVASNSSHSQSKSEPQPTPHFILATNPILHNTTVIPMPQMISYIAINEKANQIYAAGSDSIFIINGYTNKVINTIPLDKRPTTYIKFNESTNTIYVLAGGLKLNDQTLYAIDGSTNKIVANIPLNQTTLDIDIDENKNMTYVLGYDPLHGPWIGSDSISVINGTTNQGIQNIPLLHIKSANAMTINPETGMLHILSKSSESVSAIDATSTSNEILGK